ncbi:cation-dependent mannose-6-phosphate receptor-like [Mercenaria mercenaria]|uniref:cation-dependent mannose-6-phosphate receptor-like n=1 Tax=Mercenaria mercenaria TaxID=6596 RepID=UPI00234ED6E9|nr:cation-dependent mannose-6-phosphate receptor-like [Mercenaria mercenaria]
MDFDQMFIFVYLMFASVWLTLGEECKKVESDNCSCRTSKGTVDLHKIPNSILSIANGTYTYQYKPCESLQEECGGVTGGVAACQRSGSESYDIGNTVPVTFAGDPDKNLRAVYTATDPATHTVRISIFSIKCDRSTTGKLTSVNENPTNTYNFELRTQYACLGSSGGNTPSNKKISTGSVLLIIFFVFLAIYFIAGILFLKSARGATGTELIPNYDFWTSLPGYIKDGVMFTCRGCKTESSYSQI